MLPPPPVLLLSLSLSLLLLLSLAAPVSAALFAAAYALCALLESAGVVSVSAESECTSD
jgi:hypothetical protein